MVPSKESSISSPATSHGSRPRKNPGIFGEKMGYRVVGFSLRWGFLGKIMG
jgi:hypothetical protein